MVKLRRGAKVELAVFDDGVLARGSDVAIDALRSELEAMPGRLRRPSLNILEGLTGLMGLKSSDEAMAYFKLSGESVRALSESSGGRLPTGWVRGVVRDGDGSILKHLDLQKVRSNPQQVLSLQGAAVALALRTAVAEVLDAVERVEDKVDDVARLIRSERLGNALGDRRTLASLEQRLRNDGFISETDWSAIASMGPTIARDIESIRTHLHLTLNREHRSSTRGRLDTAESLLDRARIAESLQLLVVAEENHNQWQLLRLARIRKHEPQHLSGAIEDARWSVEHDKRADQQLVEALRRTVADLAEPSGTEGLAVLNAPKLRTRIDELSESLTWFADQRLLEVDTVSQLPWPGFKESAQRIARVAGSGAAGLSGAAYGVIKDRRRRRSDAVDPGDGTRSLEAGEPAKQAPTDEMP